MNTNSSAIGFSARMCSGVAAKARKWLTDLRRPGSRIASSSGAGRSAGATCGEARSSSPSSPSSLGVIMIWCGPRRPRITIRSIREASSAVERMGDDVAAGELGAGLGEDPRDVERDVAHADHDRGLARQVGIEPGELGMAVVPADERGAAEHVAEIARPECRAARSFGAPVASTTAS